MSTADQNEQHQHQAEEIWRTYMTTGQMPDYLGPPWYMKRFMRPVARWLPSEPRCRICDYPFQGIGGLLSRTLFGLVPSKMNPQLCNICEATKSAARGRWTWCWRQARSRTSTWIGSRRRGQASGKA